MNERVLLIVESPAKCKSVSHYAGAGAVALASYGHVRDLPRKGHAVHPDEDFRMDYEITEDHIRRVNDIVAAAKRADVIYLASDLDREGEAISWHVAQILKARGVTDKPIHRITFSEITQHAIQEALQHPRGLNMDLINAQQARRALDYLVGYNLSPVLWRKVRAGLSAGRVQSPALRMIVERENEIDSFDPKEHWLVTANLHAKDQDFKAKLTKLDGKKYDPFQYANAIAAKALEQRLTALAGPRLVLTRREAKERLRRPYAPFTTSTLQQAAANRLGFASARTMNLAQKLYEGVTLPNGEQTGLITYMRTDAINLAAEAVASIRGFIKGQYGDRYLPKDPVHYQNKSKNAQEAHEAIRPSDVRRTPEAMRNVLDADQLKLYTLIWQRAVACQMAPAVLNVVTFDFDLGEEASFHTAGSSVAFPGFLSVYDTQKDDDEGTSLPNLQQGEAAEVKAIVAEQKFTEPPARYNEGSIVKHLEELGIGRPSTYASIIETLKRREYVKMEGRVFHPTEIGRAVARFLTTNFAPYVDYQFTAHLEDDLDAVARGERNWTALLRGFWDPFIAMVKDKSEHASREDAKGRRCIGKHPVSGLPVYVFVGKFGGTIAVGDLTDKTVKPFFTPLPEGLHVEKVTMEDIQDELRYPIDLGEGIQLLKGRFGPYLKKDENRYSLEETQDPFTLTLPAAKELIRAADELKANRNIADFGNGVKILNGRFGPYAFREVNGKKEYASIPAGLDPKTVTAAKAIELLDTKKQHPGGGGKKFGKKKWKGGKGGKHHGGHDAKPSGKTSSIDGLPM